MHAQTVHGKKYELEKVIVTGEEGASSRREEHIAYSENYHELLEMAAKLPLKGGRYLSEWYAILELDENGEIVNHAYTMFADDELRGQVDSDRYGWFYVRKVPEGKEWDMPVRVYRLGPRGGVLGYECSFDRPSEMRATFPNAERIPRGYFERGRWTREQLASDWVTVPGGDCYRYVWKYALKRPGATFIHGTVIEPFAQDPNRHVHAWVEDNGFVYDWQTMEAGEGGIYTGKGWPIPVFYETFKPEDIIPYTRREILENTTKYNHFGPWT